MEGFEDMSVRWWFGSKELDPSDRMAVYAKLHRDGLHGWPSGCIGWVTPLQGSYKAEPTLGRLDRIYYDSPENAARALLAHAISGS